MPPFYASGRPTVIVTGAAGFLGSHLVDALLKTANVIGIDNYLTGDEHNIDSFLSHPQFEFIRHDLSTPLDFQALPELKKFKFAIQGVQQIYHLACPTSPKEYKRLPIETLDANAFATKQMLALAQRHQAKFLLTSSSAIYGEPAEDSPLPERWWGYVDPIGPRSAYNEGKRFAESLCWNYRLSYNMEIKIVRIFNTYGPRMKLNDGRMIPDFIRSAFRNEPLIINGDRDSVSTFCYVADMIDGLLKVMESEVNQPVNMGSDEPVFLRDAAAMVVRLTGSSSIIDYQEHLPYTSRQLVPDITYARNELSWWPLIKLEEGLSKTVEYMKSMAHLYNIEREQRGE
jgi:nucleoside-diphosphate-sugar epimerase